MTVFLLVPGLIMAAVILRDVFGTVVIPGGSRGLLRVVNWLVWLALPLWRRFGKHESVSPSFAPMVLLASFIVWMAALILAFGVMFYALRESFDPVIGSFSEATYDAGSTVVTLGLSSAKAHAGARWIVLIAGLCGLAVMTMAITYLLELQQNIASRDAGILKLTIASGNPPSALGALEQYAALGCQSEISQMLHDARSWCATLQQSHTAHPSLVYFRSTGAAWPIAIAALYDLALVVEMLIDDPGLNAPAVLLREQAHQTAVELAHTIGIERCAVHTDTAAVNAAHARLAHAGYTVRRDIREKAFVTRRDDELGWVQAIACHLGSDVAALALSPR